MGGEGRDVAVLNSFNPYPQNIFMTKDQKLQQEMARDYPLIPMKDIDDEARILAVRWMECGDKDWIGQKHKLASDIMNYCRRNAYRHFKAENK